MYNNLFSLSLFLFFTVYLESKSKATTKQHRFTSPLLSYLPPYKNRNSNFLTNSKLEIVLVCGRLQ
jgi:hypothetical protein